MTAALLTLPGSPAAYGPSTGPVRAERSEFRELHEVREQLARSEALQRALRGQARTMATEVEALRERHEKLSLALQSQRQQTVALERRLDHLVPRLLAQVAEARARRARTAHALAELASKSRSVRLDSTTRARMLAISPLMFKQLRGLERGPDMLEGPERTIRRHERLERSVAELTTARQRLSAELAQKRRQQGSALERLGKLDAEVQMLAAQQMRLARRVLQAESAIAARAEPQAADPAWADQAGSSGGRGGTTTVTKGMLAVDRRLAGAARRSVSEVEAGAQVPGGIPGLPYPGLIARPAVPQPTRPLAAALHGDPARPWLDDSDDTTGRAASLKVVFQPDGDAAAVGAAANGRRRGLPPLLPLMEPVARRVLDPADRPEMAFAAAPGQQVAAPVAGEVVFAGRFKSYGLLLIIAHEREYHTLLWGFARLDVGSGVPVRIGQVVGIMGVGSVDPPLLHVERRRHGRPINLAASSSGIQG